MGPFYKCSKTRRIILKKFIVVFLMSLMMFNCSDLIDALNGDSTDSDKVSDHDPLSVYDDDMKFHIENCDENYAQFGADIIYMQHIATTEDPDHEITISCNICDSVGIETKRDSKKSTDSYYVLMSDCNIDTLFTTKTIYTEPCQNEENHPEAEIPEESLMDEKIAACENGDYADAADSDLFGDYPTIYEFITESFSAVRQGDCINGDFYNYSVMVEKTDTLIHNSITDTCDRYELIEEDAISVLTSCEIE